MKTKLKLIVDNKNSPPSLTSPPPLPDEMLVDWMQEWSEQEFREINQQVQARLRPEPSSKP